MPELPEVETVRRTLAKRAIGRRVVAVTIRRADVIEGDHSPAALLVGREISDITRHGKQLVILAGGRCVCVHLGMTGSLCCVSPTDGGAEGKAARRNHIHLSWALDDGTRVEFRDPRRFGGVWTFASVDELWNTRWKTLGPDALRVRAAELAAALAATRRPIKAALLDQALVAGLGNIYVDELLFAAGVHPLTACRRISPEQIKKITARMHAILKRAIDAGGSTLRDYVNAEGQAGGFQNHHRVYGRGGRKCRRCPAILKTLRIAGRMTVYCPVCQKRLTQRQRRFDETLARLRGSATIKLSTDEILAMTRGVRRRDR